MIVRSIAPHSSKCAKNLLPQPVRSIQNSKHEQLYIDTRLLPS
jgi:hypothetical protein